MKRAEQYDNLLMLREEINKRLQKVDFESIKELIRFLVNSREYQRIKTKDNQLLALDCFCAVWLEEKKQLEPLGIYEDIFIGVNSLEDVESKYLDIKYAALRIENEVPLEYCEEAIDSLIEQKISGIAIYKVVVSETMKRISNILKLSSWLKEKGMILTAIQLLQNFLDNYKENDDILLELADCWIIGQQWKQAHECLMKIEKPNEDVLELIKEIEKVI